MTTETKSRVKQILRDCCAGNASLATDILHEEFAIFPKPKVGEVTVPQDGYQYIDGKYFSSNSDVDYWKSANPERWEHIAKLIADASKADAVLEFLESGAHRRRDELARELVNDGAYAYRYAEEPLKLAIDRIIELEASK